MRPILLGSGNEKKLAELERAVRAMGFRPVRPSELDPTPPPPDEDGDTFLANAAKKALAYAEAFGGLALADDSGLVVPVLGGRPGVLSARFSGPGATDASNNELLLSLLAEAPGEQRDAYYECWIAVALPGQVLATATGTCGGSILRSPRGTGGFGYDPLFLIPGLGRTFAQLSAEEKDSMSHRGTALKSMGRILPGILASRVAR